ncbi:MAG TPA: FtsX-like permease family protein [Candidatus Acidoferrales bacterium]|nr:FtsX-like permease family protein [Candidatus Acidoferrales bacterium]
MLDLLFACRNLTRHRVRSAISLTAIAFGVVALLLSGGFIEWIFFAMRRDTIHSLLGHIQIVRTGFFAAGAADPFAFLLPETAEVLSAVQSASSVRMITPRLSFSGILSRGESTVSFLGQGVDPEKEKEVSRFVTISQGDALSSSDPKGVILGEGLAESLGAKIGDRIVLLVNTPSGGVNAVEGHVRGLFYTLSKTFNDSALRLPIATARELLRVSGAHTWVVLLDDTDKTTATLNLLRRRFPPSTAKIEFVPWYDLADFYNKTVTLYSRQMHVVKFIIAMIVVLSISNTMMMSVLERTGEVGTLMALGFKSKKILALFVAEGFMLGLGGGLAGVVLGTALAWIISAIGIPMPPAPGMTHGFTGEILVTPGLALVAFSIAAGTSTLASLYPAWRASRLNIVDALRHNR